MIFCLLQLNLCSSKFWISWSWCTFNSQYGKAKKTFDFENVKDTEDILNKFSKAAKKDIKELDNVLSKLKTTNKSSLKIRDYIDPNLLTNNQKQMVIFLHTQDDVPMPKAISQFLKQNKKD